VYWNYQESLYIMTSALERGEMSALLHIEVALGPIRLTSSSLLTRMSSSCMEILRRGPTS
jgi:hypothetical protein